MKKEGRGRGEKKRMKLTVITILSIFRHRGITGKNRQKIKFLNKLIQRDQSNLNVLETNIKILGIDMQLLKN